MNHLCPTRTTERGDRPIRAYLLEPDVPEDEQMIELDHMPFRNHREEGMNEPEQSDPTIEEDSGNGLENHAQVGVM